MTYGVSNKIAQIKIGSDEIPRFFDVTIK